MMEASASLAAVSTTLDSEGWINVMIDAVHLLTATALTTAAPNYSDQTEMGWYHRANQFKAATLVVCFMIRCCRKLEVQVNELIISIPRSSGSGIYNR